MGRGGEGERFFARTEKGKDGVDVNGGNVDDVIGEAVECAVKKDVECAVREAVENAKADLDRRIPEIVAGVAIRVVNGVSIERLGGELLIRVRMEKV